MRVLFLLLGLAFCSTAQAQVTTWQEANKQSSVLFEQAQVEDSAEKRVQAAEMARLAGELYPQQSKAYKSTNHLQLLLIAEDLARIAYGEGGANAVLVAGVKALEDKAGADDGALIALRQKLAGSYDRLAEDRKADFHYKIASRKADDIWGENDPRSIFLLAEWGHASRGHNGGNWAKAKLREARTRAETHGEDNLLALRIGLMLAKIELELKREGSAVRAYRELIEKLVARGDMDPTLLQQSIIHLAYIYNEERDEEGLDEMMSRLAQTYEGDAEDILPMIRISPEYPSRAARLGQEGYVIMGFSIDKNGKPIDIKVVESEGGKAFEESAMEALQKWRYRPALKGGKPVRFDGLKTQLTFKLNLC